MTDSADTLHLQIDTTADIVAAYVSKNSVPVAELPNLIQSVHASLAGLGVAPAAEAPTVALVPAVSVKKSVTDDFIISLEDGRKFKSMKRYLSGLGMTPAQYRTKWNLPSDYPMVAPTYAAKRSELAKTIGLGRRAAAEALREPEPEVAETAPAEEPKKRGRAKKPA